MESTAELKYDFSVFFSAAPEAIVARYDRDHIQREYLLVSRTTDRCEPEVRVSGRPRKHEIANANFPSKEYHSRFGFPD